VATGTDGVVPPIEGLPEAGYWTTRDVYTMREPPREAVVPAASAYGTAVVFDAPQPRVGMG